MVRAGTGCTYLSKTSNANANGASGVENMTNTMSMYKFVEIMNNYVKDNNSNVSNTPLKKWKVQNDKPLFAD
ncbi:MAG: hypothetical protein IKP28_03630 [Clostridia bacterium]|nr:hypothetical protein [Clostridia bacterium]